MLFDKPKVFIDLEEYTALKEEAAGVTGNEFVVMAKKVMASFLNNRFNIEAANRELKKEGISLFYTGPANSFYLPDNITIKKIEPPKNEQPA